MNTGPHRITEAIESARAQGRAALLVSLPLVGQDPDVVREAVIAVAEAGADMVEFPTRFPQHPQPVLKAAREVIDGIDIPALLWADEETVQAFALVDHEPYRLVPACVDAGLAGVAATVRPASAAAWTAACGEDLAPVYFVAPSMPLPDIETLGTHGRGFLYAVGVQTSAAGDPQVAESLSAFVTTVREATGLPVIAGAGIRTPQQAAVAGAVCDGVAIATAVTETLADAAARDADPFNALGRLVTTLRTALEQSKAAS